MLNQHPISLWDILTNINTLGALSVITNHTHTDKLYGLIFLSTYSSNHTLLMSHIYNALYTLQNLHKLHSIFYPEYNILGYISANAYAHWSATLFLKYTTPFILPYISIKPQPLFYINPMVHNTTGYQFSKKINPCHDW